MQPTAELRKEHEAILGVLDILERISAQIEANEQFRADDVAQILDFLQHFADGCHHAKEEKHLFPALERAGVPRERGPIGVMLSEHDLGRKYVAGMSAALSAFRTGPGPAAPIAQNARAYINLLRAHIRKENEVLFPIADRALTPGVQEELSGQFEDLEEREIGHGVHERYHAMLRALHDAYAVS